MIVGGKWDLAVRERQLGSALLRASHRKGSDPGFLDSQRSRAAMVYAKFEHIPVMRKGKIVAHARGAYIAKLVRSLGYGSALRQLMHYVNRYIVRAAILDKRHKILPPVIPLHVVTFLEKCKAEKDGIAE